ncbi:MAG: DUF2794 domain-containing protein [Alphaproteobacteria bacterium]|nr:DUF2794 domain-containing protein [Alphaproteobacteria bacterium]
MSSVYRLKGPRKQTNHKQSKRVSFDRTELRVLLNEYSRRVAAGEWRDYAIDHGRDRAVFSVFRHTAEHPLYSIEKLPGHSGKGGRYGLLRGPIRLKQDTNLVKILGSIERRPNLISIG